MSLVEFIADFTPQYPGVYCIYTPLALGSVTYLIRIYKANIYVLGATFGAFLDGLTFLHETKQVMHRDINPK